MTIDADVVAAWNATHARLPLSSERLGDLALELDQLQRVVERVRAREAHSDDLLDFRTVLLATSRESDR